MQQLQEVRQQQQQPREKYDQLQQQLQRTKICIPQHPGPRKKIRSKVSEDHRQEILSTPLPPSLAVRKRHRARVAVKTVCHLAHISQCNLLECFAERALS